MLTRTKWFTKACTVYIAPQQQQQQQQQQQNTQFFVLSYWWRARWIHNVNIMKASHLSSKALQLFDESLWFQKVIYYYRTYGSISVPFLLGYFKIKWWISLGVFLCIFETQPSFSISLNAIFSVTRKIFPSSSPYLFHSLRYGATWIIFHQIHRIILKQKHAKSFNLMKKFASGPTSKDEKKS